MAFATVACGIGKNTDSNVPVPTYTSHKTINFDTVPSGVTANQAVREDVLEPMSPTECDESVEFVETGFRCSHLVNNYSISRVDGANGFSDNPVKVEVFEDHIRIIWDAVAGHALIVNGNQLAYLDGVGLDTRGKTVPTSIILHLDAWGGAIRTLDVCGWKA
jgi:hypothetical protein